MDRLWLVSVLCELGDYGAAHEQLTGIFDGAKAKRGWWRSEAKERAEQYWRMVNLRRDAGVMPHTGVRRLVHLLHDEGFD